MSTGHRDLRLELLGPVRIWRQESEVAAGPPRQVAVLSALALRVNTPVSLYDLIQAVWGEDAPTSAGANLHVYVAKLRRILEPERRQRTPAQTLVSVGQGYELRLDPDQVDTAVFDGLCTQARRERRLDDLAAAALSLETALKLWRGQALDGVPGPFAEIERMRLGELRLAALQERAEILLELGRHTHLVADLSALVREYPLRERLHQLLMLALYRCGRQAEALLAYDNARRVLVEELGVEPGGELRRLHERILAADPTLDLPAPPVGITAAAPAVPQAAALAPSSPASGGGAAVPVPAQLPHDTAGFSGRTEQLAALDEIFLTGGGEAESGRQGLIAAIDGIPGVGKTALAVHWAHRARGSFPDGQLYVDLRGHHVTQAPLEPSVVLGRFLRALGTPPDRIPADVDEQAALYRSTVSGRRLLIVLDNAADLGQVEPLLPGGDSCAVLVTSRQRMNGLVARYGARRLKLDVLTPEEGTQLLERLVSAQRVRSEPGAAEQLCRLSGHLPLALRIVGANLAGHPFETLREAARRLEQGDRLQAIGSAEGDDYAVRTAFDLSYRELGEPARRLFRLLGVVPGPDFDAPAAAVLAGLSRERAAAMLDELAVKHLVEQHAPLRYRMHDLLRLYAANRAAAEEPPQEQAAAVRRLITWHMDTVGEIVRTHHVQRLSLPRAASSAGEFPPLTFTSKKEALAWFEVERPNLLADVRHAAEHGPYELAWQLADTLRGLFRLRPQPTEWLLAAEAALEAARRAGDLHAQAAMRLSLADAHQSLGRDDLSLHDDYAALELSRRAGWREGEAAALGGIGRAHWVLGHLKEAMRHLTESVAKHRECGSLEGEAAGLGSLGRAYHDLGDWAEARARYRESLEISQRVGSRFGEALGHFYLGAVEREAGRAEPAFEHLTHGLRLSRQFGFRQGIALSVSFLCALHAESGRPEEAREHLKQAEAALQETGDRRVEVECLSAMAAALVSLGEPCAAQAYLDQALRISRTTGYVRGEVQARYGMAVVYLRAGDREEARRCYRRASAIAERSGHRPLAGLLGRMLNGFTG